MHRPNSSTAECLIQRDTDKKQPETRNRRLIASLYEMLREEWCHAAIPEILIPKDERKHVNTLLHAPIRTSEELRNLPYSESQ